MGLGVMVGEELNLSPSFPNPSDENEGHEINCSYPLDSIRK